MSGECESNPISRVFDWITDTFDKVKGLFAALTGVIGALTAMLAAVIGLYKHFVPDAPPAPESEVSSCYHIDLTSQNTISINSSDRTGSRPSAGTAFGPEAWTLAQEAGPRAIAWKAHSRVSDRKV